MSDTTSPPASDDYPDDALNRARDLLAAMPDHVGRYRVLERLGGGGMGVVYVAEQTEPIRRRVAVKVIKAGMDTRQVVARFEAERQALAMMDHPNIARVFDAGTTDTGRPYFVMELVRGVPITQFCDDAKLSTRQRVQLLVPVCQAVQHAHQKGIIHRDLKPTNVLVTLHDGKPVPKVIDFGIAKATGPNLTDKTIYTEFRQVIGTPAYMSPEQAEMSGLDIDTRSDIYSLGVLTYELLTGTTPFDTERLFKAGLAEIQRIIKEEDPPRPSLRISTLGERLTTMATQRGCEPGRIGKLVAGELDWIVMRAMEKDRRRRYETANDLAADFERHLAGEPIVAAPPGAGYRARKFVHKYRRGVTATATATTLLTLGIIGTSWQAFRARQEKARAEQATRQMGDAQHLAMNTLGEIMVESNADDHIPDLMASRNPQDAAEAFVAGMNAFRGKGEPERSGIEALALLAKRDFEGLREQNAAARTAKDAAETEAYIANLALAQAAMQADRWPEARQRLNACPESKRGWEWTFLHRQADCVRFAIPSVQAWLSPDSTHILLWTGDIGKSANYDIYDAANGQRTGTIRVLNGYDIDPKFSPDSRYVLLASVKDAVQKFTLDGHSASLPMVQTPGKRNGGWGFSPDSQNIFTFDDNAIKIWDREGKLVTVLQHPDIVTDVVFGPNGESCVSTAKKLRLWNTHAGTAVVLSDDELGDASTVLFSEKSKLFLVCDQKSGQTDFQISFWNLEGQCVGGPFKSSGDQVQFTSDGTAAMFKSEDGVRRLELNGQSNLVSLAGTEFITRLDDGRLIGSVTSNLSGMLKLHATNGKLLATGRDGYGEYQCNPSSSVLTVVNGSRNTMGMGSLCAITDIEHLDWPIDLHSKPRTQSLEAAFSESTEGSQITKPKVTDMHCELVDGVIKITSWGKSPLTVKLDQVITAYAFTPDGCRVVTINDESRVRFWNSSTGREITSITTRAGVKQLRFTPDGTRLILDFADGTMEIWDTRDYAARQKDRDARFDEIPAAKAYVQALLASTASGDADTLKDAVRKDATISRLRKLVALEQLDLEFAKRRPATQPATQGAGVAG